MSRYRSGVAAALVACGWLLSVGGSAVAEPVSTGPTPVVSLAAAQQMAAFFDDRAFVHPASFAVGSGASGDVQQGCDPTIQRQLNEAVLNRIDAERELAKRIYSVLEDAEWRAMTCLERLLSLASISIIFPEPGSGLIQLLQRLLDRMIDTACGKATQMVRQATEPLNRTVNVGVDLDRMIPGLGLGRVGGFVAVRPGGAGGLGSVSINGRQVDWMPLPYGHTTLPIPMTPRQPGGRPADGGRAGLFDPHGW